MDIICSTHVQCMYRYIHSMTSMTMYMQCMYMVHTKSVQAHTGFNQLYQQVFVDNTEMQNRGISLSPLLQGRIWMGAVPVQKMVICSCKDSLQVDRFHPPCPGESMMMTCLRIPGVPRTIGCHLLTSMANRAWEPGDAMRSSTTKQRTSS